MVALRLVMPRPTSHSRASGPKVRLWALRPLGAHHPQPVHEQHNDGHDDDSGQDIAGILEAVEDVTIATAELVTHGGEHGTPHGATDHGEEDELGNGHLAQIGRASSRATV